MMPKHPKQHRPKPDMIFWMQLKFVALAMGILIIVFLIMLSSINMMMRTVSQHQSMQLLRQIAESERYNTLAPDGMEEPLHEPLPEEQSEPLLEASGYRQNTVTVQPMAYRNWWEEETQNGTYWWENDRWGNNWGDHNPDWQETDATEAAPPTPPPLHTRPTLEENPPQTIPPPPAIQPPATTAAPTDPLTEDTALQTVPAPTEPYVPPQTVPPETTAPQTETSAIEQTTASETTSTTRTTTRPPEPPQKPDKWNITISIDHFALLAGHNGEFLGLRNTEDYTEEEAGEIMSGILQSGQTQGMYGWLQYYSTPKEYGTLIVVTDKTSDQGLLNNLFRITVIVGCLMLLVLLVILCILSGWITKPVQTAFARQKQFVSDAGHELKTPLTVLSANADILQDEIGENKWLGYIQEQTARMNQLVGDLLHLARMDNAAQEYEMKKFNLSAAINATALPFESQAFEMNRNLELDIQSGVEYCGSEKHIRQLAAIFIDNALKYSNENGIIKITLMKRGEKAVLEFYNTGCEISQAETEKIFERFYRGDKARNSKGKNGYGLGLAIAKSIMNVHKIRLQVTCVQGRWIRFLLTM